MSRHRITTLGAVGAIVLLSSALLAGCSSSPDASPAPSASAASLDDLYTQAVNAGQTTLTVYGPSEASFAPVYDEFMKKYPKIKVATEFLFGGDLRTRVDQEAATGQHVGDLIHLDDSVTYVGNLQPMTLAGVPSVPADVSLLGGKLVVPSRSLYTMIYNTDKMAEKDAPKSWADVATATSLKGVMGMSDPKSLAATSTVLYTAYKNGAINDSWLSQVAGMSPKIYQSTSQMVGGVATGEISFTPVAYYGFVVTQKAKGAHISHIIPSDGVVLADNPYGMLDGAPSPLAAQLLMSWLLTSDGQAALAQKGYEYGTMSGAPAPSGLPALSAMKVFPQPAPADRAQFKQDAVTLMKKFF